MGILKYNDDLCFIAHNNVAFEIKEKPQLSFLFDTIYHTEIEHYYVINNQKKKLTKSQRTECDKYCEKFFNERDYYVFAYNDNKIFIRKMLKSEANKNNYNYIINVIPKYPVSRWNEEINNWEKITTIIKDDGTVIHNPTSFCKQCVIFLTQEETNNLPDINKYNDNYHKYDFDSKTWFTIGDELSDKKKYLDFRVRQLYDIKKWKNVFNHYSHEYERYGWEIEREEALSWINNNKASTPFIDGLLVGLDDNTITKKDYINKILDNISEEKSYNLGKLHGEMMKYINMIKKSKSIEELNLIENKLNLNK